ncbi:MAG: hypothetical protein QNJ40_04945 [Xanthomonadales bacterium]|nr:hypothetical protein [Xanthomonadales bacterium]
MRIWILLLLCGINTACVIDARVKDTVIGPERQVAVPVNERSIVSVRIPAGDVDVLASDGEDLTAELVIRCASEDSACARRLRDVSFVTRERRDGSISITLSRNSSTGYRDAEVQATIYVPKAAQLALDMTAGDLHVGPINACVEVDMGAGDVNVFARTSDYRSVDIDAGVGDASLSVDGRNFDAPRSWLVGAQMEWRDGSGRCDMVVDLQAGDIDVRLN